MKGRIDQYGQLHIDRVGAVKMVGCPVMAPYEDDPSTPKPCGDWCALFSEPEPDGSGGATIDLCQSTLEFDEFTDERKRTT